MIYSKWAYGTVFVCTLLFAPQVSAATADLPCQRAILTLLAPEIQAQVGNYYKDKLTETPTFAPFLGGNRLEIESFSSHLDVVVTVIPYVGPHLSVGKDRMTFRIDNTGKVIAESYAHIEDINLPPNWKHIRK
ncbi:DUF3888 domain-containing protein [Paenibacillus sacheonensis]|uniref:DUF3888 domain-containing protein n=1 Tax=Paenibacillus sacheonensis TaxID=742054 RepID=A0A7X4YPL9_9BACL|nr:DUF3888 domain-containing protein [Paenibacillus sacheonensis]MBM7564994.1 hypothetical protein [Paenibacillus sacheonensis]NBC70220.1 DUF3888 domain-containing protein [Paenibacillus sacheonensis]